MFKINEASACSAARAYTSPGTGSLRPLKRVAYSVSPSVARSASVKHGAPRNAADALELTLLEHDIGDRAP